MNLKIIILSELSQMRKSTCGMSVCVVHHLLFVDFLMMAILHQKIYKHGASLVAQWLRICLLMQGTRV